jgi:hypothetical protein
MPKKQQTNNMISVDIAVISEKLDAMRADLNDIKKKMEESVATKEWCMSRYDPTRTNVAYIVGIFGTTIVGAIATFVVRGGFK